MWKTLLSRVGSCLFLITSVATADAQLTSLTEGFDTVGAPVPTATGIFASGWVVINNSSPLGNANWNQGIPGIQLGGLGVNAQSGAANSFIQTNFQVANGGIASDWLITPVLELENGATISFYTQTNVPVNTQFPNELQVWESQSGSSTVNVGSTAAAPGGDFTVQLLDINPGATAENGTPDGYPTAWMQYTLTISGLSAPTDGRIGFRYYLPDAATQGTTIGIDTFSFADPTVFTRTVSGNWTDTTGWTPNAVPNGTTVTAQLVNPGSGTNNVNLGGGTFTVNQLQFSGTNAGTWNVTNGTIVFDGTSPTFLNQGDSNGLVGSLPNLTLNATTTFEIDNASAVTDVTGAVTGTGGLIKTGSGALVLIGTNTYSGGTTISAGTLQIGNGGTSGSIVGNVTDNGTLAFDRSDTVAFGAVISGTGSLGQLGSGTLVLTGTNTYSGGTTISAGTLQIGNGGTTGSITGNVTDNGALAFDRSDSVTFAGVISGTGRVSQIGSGTTILTGTNTYSGGTTISSGTLQIGNGGTAGSIAGNVTDNGVLAFDRSDSVTFAGAISSTGSLTQIGTGTTILTGTNTYSGGTTISSGTLQIGNGGTAGSITGNVTDHGVLAFDRSDSVTFAGVISGTGSVTQIGTGTTILTGSNTYNGGTTIGSGTLQIGNGGTAGSITGNVTDAGVLAFDRSDSVTFAGVISGTGSVTQIGPGTTILTGANAYSGGTTIGSGTLQIGNGGTAGSITGNVTDAGVLAFDRSDSLTFAGAISGTGSVTQIGTGTTILTGTNTYSGGTTISSGTLQIGNGGTAGSITGNVTDAGVLAFDRSDSVTFAGVISGTGSVTQIGPGTTILTGTNTYTGGTTISAGTLQVGNGGTAGSITGNVTDNGVLAFDRSDSVTFAGVISGTGSVTQIGTGTTILTGTNTYSGGTTISAGTLQVGNGGPTGSIIGNVTDNGSLIFNRSNALSIGGVISGAGSIEQNGSGTTVLSGINTYSGGTIVNAGTLTVNSAQALGLGAVEVNGGILRADPQPINVLGNYTQNAGGTLQLQVAGANPGQYDALNVGGNAALGGTLQLLSLGFQPKADNQLTLVTTGGVVSGRFAQLLNPFPTGPGFNTFDLVYGRNSVQLQFLNVTTPISPVIPTVPTTPSSPPAVPPKVVATLNFASFAFTPNQRSTATLLDQVELDPRTANLIGFLFKQPLANLPGDFEQISPAGLTAFYEISFSGANIQKLNLEGRSDDIRNGANGFRSNVKVNGASVNLEDKATADRNSSKAVVEPILQPGPENRWGVWMTGFGDFVSVDADSNAQGYDFTTGGVSLGIDYRILDHLAIGVMGDYAHTWTSLNPSGHIDVDTGRGGVYATWFNHGLYLNAAIYGGHNSYDSSRSTLGGLAAGGTEGAEFSTFAGGGYDFNFGHVTVGPIASIQYTYVSINGFSEESSLAPLEIHSASARSLRTDFGFRASFHWQIGKILVEPAIKAAWEHEYKYSALPITAGFAAIPGPSATFFGPSEGHDSAVVDAGITVQLTPAIATYLNYDGQLGRDRYDSNAVTGGVRVSF